MKLLRELLLEQSTFSKTVGDEIKFNRGDWNLITYNGKL
jgi:hypothetical protein